MAVEIIEVDSGPGLKDWVTFPNRLYRGDPRYVPQLIGQELDFFDRAKNPSFKIAQTRLLAARRDGRLVGRVCGIIHQLEAAKLGFHRGRFGWFECAEDPEAAAALLGALESWFREEGCREMTGPHGFTDLDPEGMLVEGFDAQPTISGSYNKPYYPALVEALGFQKEIDYIETRFEVPRETPAVFQMMEKKVHPVRARRRLPPGGGPYQGRVRHYAGQFWEVLEASFAHLYGVTPLTEEQKAFYQKKYFGFIDPRFLQLVVDGSGRLQGFFLGLPSLSRAFQRAGGRLFPLGFYHILRAFKRFDSVDFYFAGVHPQANPKKILPLMITGHVEGRQGVERPIHRNQPGARDQHRHCQCLVALRGAEPAALPDLPQAAPGVVDRTGAGQDKPGCDRGPSQTWKRSVATAHSIRPAA